MKTLRLASMLLISLAAGTAAAAPINLINPASLVSNTLLDFESIGAGAPPGISYDTILAAGQVQFAQGFAGQVNTPSGFFDSLSGTPNPRLSLALGPVGTNLSVLDLGGNNLLTGIGSLGFPAEDAVGEGSIAMLFSSDQVELGFELVGGNSGTAVAQFFRRDGSLIDVLTLALNNDFSQIFAFRRDGSADDIAGVSIHNTDTGGLAFDGMRYTSTVAGVPEPGSLALAGLALLGASLSRRRKG